MRIGTANIRNHPDMPRAAVEADIHTVARRTSLCGLQEIQPGEDTPVVRYALPEHWGMFGGAAESPIVWNADRWHLEDSDLITWERPRLPRPENPTPGITSCVFRSRRRPELPRFAVVNTHLVAGAYNAQRLLAVQAQWHVEWRMVLEEVRRLHRGGLTVYVLGDFNRGVMPGPNWLTPDGPPDHVGELVSVRSVHLAHPEHTPVLLNSDHKLHVVSGTLERVPGSGPSGGR